MRENGAAATLGCGYAFDATQSWLGGRAIHVTAKATPAAKAAKAR